MLRRFATRSNGLRRPDAFILPGAWGPFLSGVMWFILKISVFIFLFYWIRATFPRYRYDQLMSIGWKWLLPLSLANILATGALMLWLGKAGG